VIRKILEIVRLSTGSSILYLVLVTVIGTVLELVGIAAIVPIIDSIVNAEESFYSRFDLLQSMDRTSIIYASIFLFVSLYFLKSIFLAFLAWMQTGFVYGIQRTVSEMLFAKYMGQTYTYHTNVSSSVLIRNVTHETLVFAEKSIYPAVLLTSELLVLVGIFSLLLWFDFLSALTVIGTLITAGYLYHALTSNKNAQWGIDRHDSDGMRIKWLQESLSMIKEIKLKHCEQYFSDGFADHNKKSTSVSRLQSAFQRFPGLWLEFVAIILIALLVILSISQNGDMSGLPVTIGVFSMAAFRALPSANRVLSAIHSLKYANSSVNSIYNDIFKLENSLLVAPDNTVDMSFGKSIEVEDVSLELGKNKILDTVNITIPLNKTVGIIGKSGSGKSTLVNIMAGLIRPTSGCVRVDGVDIDNNLTGWQRNIGYVPQDVVLLDKSIEENVAFGMRYDEIDMDRYRDVIDMVNLSDLFGGLSKDASQGLGERGVKISGGQKQRVGIARALYSNPKVLILDEATSALDGENQEKIISLIQSFHGSVTIVVVAHRMSVVRGCDIIYQMSNGSVDKVLSGDEVREL